MAHSTAPSLGASTYAKPNANVQSIQAQALKLEFDPRAHCIGYLKTLLLLSGCPHLPYSRLSTLPLSLKKQRGNVARSPSGVVGTERTWCRDGIFGSPPSNPYDYQYAEQTALPAYRLVSSQSLAVTLPSIDEQGVLKFDPIPGGIVRPSLVWRASIQDVGPVFVAMQKMWHRDSGANEWVL
ncbi:uncharacterized protein ARMOST_02964 [Armillaria ostoyae]|uniref:Uncharacterized protein n=1 Tax=Armillaria ostoyae TaxID=47428 RepID=A0A284QT59_ARMOS|nr:uncharacterized protein ARMOST_02964 [Armillaria ostoyae]